MDTCQFPDPSLESEPVQYKFLGMPEGVIIQSLLLLLLLLLILILLIIMIIMITI